MKLPVTQLLAQIKAAHARSVEHSRKAVEAVLECGRLLKALKLQLGEGETWVAKVEELGIAKRTADRYIACAAIAAKNPAKTKWLLEQGASLVDLYREFDLVKPVEPGGYKSEVYQRRKANEQLELDFSYEEALPHLNALVKARNVEELSPSTRRRLLDVAEAAARRLRDSLKDDDAINLKDHQP